MRRRLAAALVCLFAGPVIAAPPALNVCKRPELTSTTKQGDAKAREAPVSASANAPATKADLSW